MEALKITDNGDGHVWNYAFEIESICDIRRWLKDAVADEALVVVGKNPTVINAFKTKIENANAEPPSDESKEAMAELGIDPFADAAADNGLTEICLKCLELSNYRSALFTQNDEDSRARANAYLDIAKEIIYTALANTLKIQQAAVVDIGEEAK